MSVHYTILHTSGAFLSRMWLKADTDDPNAQAKDEAEYYPRIPSLNYMITDTSPQAHKDIRDKQWHPEYFAGGQTITIKHRGVGEKKAKKVEVENIKGCEPRFPSNSQPFYQCTIRPQCMCCW